MEGSYRSLADQEPEAYEEGQEGRSAADQRDPAGGNKSGVTLGEAGRGSAFPSICPQGPCAPWWRTCSLRDQMRMTHHQERRTPSRPTQAGSPGTHSIVKLGPGCWSKCKASLIDRAGLGNSRVDQAFLFIMASVGIYHRGLSLATYGKA